MTERERLPDRRASETFALECAGLKYTATISRFADGRLGEIFLSNHKAGSHADTAARDSAIVCSIALQFNADLETIRRALCRDSHGAASGPLGVALDRLSQLPPADEATPAPPPLLTGPTPSSAAVDQAATLEPVQP
jgi:hypothetical protein